MQKGRKLEYTDVEILPLSMKNRSKCLARFPSPPHISEILE